MLKKIAFLFPGQGSQSVGMLDALAAEYPVVQQTFEEASDIVAKNLWQLITVGPAEVLDQTENTQPIMLAAGIAVWRIWKKLGGLQPAMLAGHSLGEYTALVVAEALTFSDGIKLAAERARFMQAAVPLGQGAMAALIGFENEQILKICHEQAQGSVLAAANFNAPGQTVIAGEAAAVARAIACAQLLGTKRAILLPVSVPSHCELMRPAALLLAKRLENITFATPLVPIIHNVTAAPAVNTQELPDLLIQQLFSPVRWVESVQAMIRLGATIAIECGPGRVLAGLGKRINKSLNILSIYDPKTLDLALKDFN